MTSVNDLLNKGLTPQEFMAACVLLTYENDGVIRVRIEDVAALMTVSRATAHRSIQGIVEKGILIRCGNGVYALPAAHQGIPQVRQEVSLVRQEISQVRQTGYVEKADRTTSDHRSIREPNGSLISRGTPEKGITRIVPIYYETDDGDHLAGVGRPENHLHRKRPTRAERRETLKYHRLTPRDKWSLAHVVKEFRHRMASERPDLLGGGTNGAEMTIVLQKWSKDHGLSIADMASAVDRFFEDAAIIASLTETPPAYRRFLSFLQHNYREITRSQVSDDWVTSLDTQMEAL